MRRLNQELELFKDWSNPGVQTAGSDLGYFGRHAAKVKLVGTNLRRAQSGAIHAILSHFTLHAEPAVAVMPTGSGKTAVLFLSPFVLPGVRRVLIVTPSRLVRAQIAAGAASQGTLKKLGVLPDATPGPKVKEVTELLSNQQAWNELEDFDIVVSTPNCCSPEAVGVAAPPTGLFDIILVDEAHHSPAQTWAGILNHFETTPKILFTATPFRRDRREIKGRFVYNYPLRRAQKDGIFGKIEFVPVTPANGNSDLVIAKRAESVLQEARKKFPKQRLLVRTDSRQRADELFEVYAQNTSLKLQKIHSGHSLAHVTKAIEKLRSGDLDGIVCVDMLGEGFDFPELKIAAIHSPHKSLAITLQFIGRFARTGEEDLGDAKFIAIPQDIGSETEVLYQENSSWQDIVANLSEARTTLESDIKEIAGSFERVHIVDETMDLDRLDLLGCTPFAHTVIYEVKDCRPLSDRPELPPNLELGPTEFSTEHNAVVFVTTEVEIPEWARQSPLENIRYELFVIHHNPELGFLFITATRRTQNLYEMLAKHYSQDTHQRIAPHRLRKVLLDLEKPVFFNVGLKNRTLHANSESYRTLAGPSAQKSVTASDAILYSPGHLMGRASENGTPITIGFSSGGKVWSNTNKRVSEMILWYKQLAKKLRSDRKAVTLSMLDQMGAAEEVQVIPDTIIAIDWNEEVYRAYPRIILPDGSDDLLAAATLVLDRASVTKTSLRFKVCFGQLSEDLEFTLSDQGHNFTRLTAKQFQVKFKNESMGIDECLREAPLNLYLPDFAVLTGNVYLKRPEAGSDLFPREAVRTPDWAASGVDIEAELQEHLLKANTKAIHQYVAEELIGSNAVVVIKDHRSGEIADFVVIDQVGDKVYCELYHCKGSGGPNAGDRVDDIYEVSGQVIKSAAHFRHMDGLRKRITERIDSGSVMLKGTREQMRGLLLPKHGVSFEFGVTLVQPGVAYPMSDKINSNVCAASDYFKQASGGVLRIWVSCRQ